MGLFIDHGGVYAGGDGSAQIAQAEWIVHTRYGERPARFLSARCSAALSADERPRATPLDGRAHATTLRRSEGPPHEEL